MREAVGRLSNGRLAWLWLLAEPIMQICMMLFMFTVIRMRVVSGISTEAWLIIGLGTYVMFKRPSSQLQSGIGANRALFTYRQVRPMDTMLVRAWLEGFINLLILTILFAGGNFFGVELIPQDPLMVLNVLLGMWLMGLGYGLITSVAVELIPKISILLGFLSTLLHLSSGVILPINHIPLPYRNWLLANPLLHGTELARQGVSSLYHPLTGVNISYLYLCGITLVFFGLALQRRFETRMLRK